MKTHSLTILSIVLLLSCSHDITIPERSDLSADQIQKLRCHGFDPDKVEYQNGQYLVDGDYLIGDENLRSSDQIEKLLDINSDSIGVNELENRQYSAYSENTQKVNMNNAIYISYYIDPALNTPNILNNWKSNIQNAATKYNDIEKCRVFFQETSNLATANLVFFLHTGSNNPPGWPFNYNWNQSSQFVGQACWPSNGKIGKYIGLKPTISSAKTSIAMHEIGHTLGFRHICVEEYTSNDNCGSTSLGLYKINGTADCDNSSIMKINSSTTTFSENDKLALQYSYPDYYNAPTISSITKYQAGGSWYAKIKTSTLPSPQVPYRIVIARYTQAGALKETHVYFGPTNNNIKEFNVQVPTGLWLYKVWYMNHGAYAVSSSAVSITI